MKQSFEQIANDIENSRISATTTDMRHQEYLPHEDSDQEENKLKLSVSHSRKPYGNLVMLRTATPHISLGPDFWCFIPAVLAFAVAAFFVMMLVFESSKSMAFRVTSVLICGGQVLSYLLVGLSNPGVVVEPAIESEQAVRNCSKCNMNVPRHARHCNDCGVCIVHYDHHCPWTSKCIGGGNLVRFYVFLGMTPIFMIYCTVAFVVCMSNNLTKIQHLPKTL